MRVHVERLGVWSPDIAFRVTREDIAAFAEATNDVILAHLRGDIAPPSFNWMPYWKSGLSHAIGAGTVETSPEQQALQVHGEHDLHLHAPIVADTDIILRGRVLAVRLKSTGTTLTTNIQTRTADGQPIATQYATAFYRGVTADREGGEAPPSTDDVSSLEGRGSAAVVQRVEPGLPTQYAAASGDHNPIHLDNDAARAVGLPGVIAHGMSIFALATNAAIAACAAGDPSQVQRIGARFSRPVIPGEVLTTQFSRHQDDNNDRVERWTFRTANGAGDAVLTKGHLELRPA